MRATAKLKQLIQTQEMSFFMEAHNGLSARIVQESGFPGIWASGLAISAQLGMRDSNEASWSQLVDIVDCMTEAANIPVLVDADTGFGNFNNARHVARKLEKRGAAGICLEDKLFPKTNSFVSSKTQLLADEAEFCGKIKAVRDFQRDEDFVLVARTEAFIAGTGLDDALRRADEYRQAGADAVLVHSKRNDIVEIEQFMTRWKQRLPVIIVPTKYWRTPTPVFEKLGVRLVIWANQTLRASISSMQRVTKHIYETRSVHGIETDIAPLEEVFRLQKVKELVQAENMYLPETPAKPLSNQRGNILPLQLVAPSARVMCEADTWDGNEDSNYVWAAA
jgi:phosphoenolpyruvate phosphomutase